MSKAPKANLPELRKHIAEAAREKIITEVPPRGTFGGISQTFLERDEKNQVSVVTHTNYSFYITLSTHRSQPSQMLMFVLALCFAIVVMSFGSRYI